MTESHLRATVSLRGVVFADGDVLVVRRASDGGWELPGGRLAPTEDVHDGVRREIREETGLSPTVEEPVHTVSWRNDADEGRLAVYFYCSDGTRTVSLSEEHVEATWDRPSSAAERLSTPQGRAVERAATAHRRVTTTEGGSTKEGADATKEGADATKESADATKEAADGMMEGAAEQSGSTGEAERSTAPGNER